MLKYLIIQLDDTSASFCHYGNPLRERRLIPLERLRQALIWSMKENLNVQILYPDYMLPAGYKAEIDRVDHADIVPCGCADADLAAGADVVVCDSTASLAEYRPQPGQGVVLRCTIAEFIDDTDAIAASLPRLGRLNVMLTDVEALTDDLAPIYGEALGRLAKAVAEEYAAGHSVECNLLTDRLQLDKMNNCGAGSEHLTVAPDGLFYICPAFYTSGRRDDDHAAGDIESGPDIKNRHLYSPAYAPICGGCDAYQCKRCVWLNRRLTLEVNTPGRQQCVMAHTERNASRRLLAELRRLGEFMPGVEIPEIDYLDPFDKIIRAGSSKI